MSQGGVWLEDGVKVRQDDRSERIRGIRGTRANEISSPSREKNHNDSLVGVWYMQVTKKAV
ncbi:hypothetical protein RRF57_004339 [Xylaria bambusicola]|uniref:Uncharacterized protein n=1 Tax=Xylaria bambusicola TaxID=326684 RepID=A0AAN7UW22_9PEZI